MRASYSGSLSVLIGTLIMAIFITGAVRGFMDVQVAAERSIEKSYTVNEAKLDEAVTQLEKPSNPQMDELIVLLEK